MTDTPRSNTVFINAPGASPKATAGSNLGRKNLKESAGDFLYLFG
ncbi:MAG: hypothetical protein ACR2KU_04120 [Gammaproteobacteria bacterium]